MSFKCGICGETSLPGDKAFYVTLETREKVYPYRKDAHQYKNNDGHPTVRDDPGGKGQEIVREVLAHQACALP